MIAKLPSLLPYARCRWRLLIVILLMSCVSSAFGVLQPWPMKILIDFGLGDAEIPLWIRNLIPIHPADVRPRLPIILFVAASTFVIFAVNSALGIAMSLAWMAAGQKMVYELATDLFAKLQRLSLGFHARHSIGDNLDRLSADTWSVYSLISDLFVSPAQHSVTLLALGVVAWQLDPMLTLISGSVVPVLAISVHFFGPLLKRRAKQGREAHSELTQFVHQTLSSIPLVQAFGTEEWNQQRFGVLVSNAVQVAQRGTLLNKSFSLVSGLATTISLATVLFVGGQRVLSGALSVGSLVIFLAYVRTLQNAAAQLLNTFAKFKATEASLERVFEIMDSREDIKNPEFPKTLSGSDSPARICFESVSVGYEVGRRVLHEISAEIMPGEKVAVVGATGAGKTTLLSLIPRHLDVWEGRVLVNGVDVRDVSLDDLRGQITIVTQEPFLLPLSVADNIAYANVRATRDQIVAAAKAAQAHEFIVKLRLGYDTMVGQRGETLSGGERQRLALARALIRPATLVILDEPTAALDSETEHALMLAMDLLRKRATLLIIAHRLSTIRNSDRVLVLENGRLIESGSPQELLARRGAFFAFNNLSRVAAVEVEA